MASKPLQLGRPSRIPSSPDKAELDRLSNPHVDTVYVARFTAPEFTCLCPITGQPDFALLVIDYAPKAWLLESKSLKLYLASFRNHGAFHEDCTIGIGKRLAALSSHVGCASAAIGIRAAAFRSTYSGRPESCRPASGCPTRACRPTARGVDAGSPCAGAPRPKYLAGRYEIALVPTRDCRDLKPRTKRWLRTGSTEATSGRHGWRSTARRRCR